MRLSNKGRYGVRALFDIAFHNDGRPTQIKDIAARESIPPRFLEQIFQDLKRAGLVGAKRGPRGGYHLARPAVDIRLGDVVRALEGPITITGSEESNGAALEREGRAAARAAAGGRAGARREGSDASAGGADEGAPLDGHDVSEVVFRELSRRIEGCFDDVTIADMCRRGDELGLRKVRERYVYVI